MEEQLKVAREATITLKRLREKAAAALSKKDSSPIYSNTLIN